MAAQTSGTAALAPAVNTKRLSTVPRAGPSSPAAPKAASATAGSKDVVSPGELCAFVDTLLNQLEARFDEMSEQMLSKMDAISARIDGLENSIQDLTQSDIDRDA